MIWRQVVFCLLIMALALTMGGCSRASQQSEETPDVSLTLTMVPNPPVVGPATLTLTLTDDAGAPIDGVLLNLKGDMAHAGMQPMLASVSDSHKGVYKTPFAWTMAGDWVLTVQAKLPDGRFLSRRFELRVGGG